MSLTAKEAVATSTTKANTGGATGALAPAIAVAITKGIEAYFMIDLSLEIEVVIIGAITGTASYWLVWLFPNRQIPEQPKECNHEAV